jgi:predicted outer membrane repeat protein
VVTTTNDSGSGSLRQAIADAPAGAEITFHPTLIAYPAAITLNSQLAINKSLTISGPGASHLSLSGNNAARVLAVSGSGTVVAISDLTIENGNAGNAPGGGIWNQGSTLTLIRCQVRGNTSTVDIREQGGGGLGNLSGTVVLEDCTFSGNTAARGGGVYTIGGILTISGSTFTQNAGSAFGGGVYHRTGVTSLTNSTISGNSTDGEGGGIFAIYEQVTLTSCTVTANTASRGGGISNSSDLPTREVFSLTDMLLAGNTGGSSPECAGPVESGGYNLLDDPTGCSIHGTTTGNITGSDPLLGDFADNGGEPPRMTCWPAVRPLTRFRMA